MPNFCQCYVDPDYHSRPGSNYDGFQAAATGPLDPDTKRGLDRMLDGMTGNNTYETTLRLLRRYFPLDYPAPNVLPDPPSESDPLPDLSYLSRDR